MQITSLGFQFLLHSPHAQLWELLLQYLRMAEVRVRLCQRFSLSKITLSRTRNAKWT